MTTSSLYLFKKAWIANIRDTRSAANLIPLKIIRALFPKSTVGALCAIKINSVILKTYNQSSSEQLGICSVGLRHKYKIAKCIFFVMPGDSPVLLVMLDIKLSDILKIMKE